MQDVSVEINSSSPLSVSTVSWSNISFSVNKKSEKKQILSNVSGFAAKGELVALMGSSGSGKSTLLNILARRLANNSVSGSFKVDGQDISSSKLQRLSTYVEQEDALIGSLNVFETVDFAAKLAFPPSFSAKERISRVNTIIESFGLSEQRSTAVGTVVKKGISGGQKRRVSVASQLITLPKIVFLDEPTSGLDSVASYEVISCVRDIARENNMIVIASIHQPSTSTFNLFDRVLLLSRGETVYYGLTTQVTHYFSSIGHECPTNYNPAEYMLELTNIDFAKDKKQAEDRLTSLFESWKQSPEWKELEHTIEEGSSAPPAYSIDAIVDSNSQFNHRNTSAVGKLFHQTWTLLHRQFIKSYRDVLSYGVRLAMYAALAILMGTVWLRLDSDQGSIQSYINALFFASAFLSFMAVAYIPAFMEDLSSFAKERNNGMYGSTAFILSNIFIGMPFLFIIALVFSLISYWLINFRSGATHFFTYLMWLYLDLLAAESLVVLITSILPIFVVALALTAFANGLWMTVGGFLVNARILNDFWYYTFYWIDYQRYVFEGMLFNEIEGRVYDCDSDCNCMFQTSLASECKIDGIGVLKSMGNNSNHTGMWVGILIAITFCMRLMAWGWLSWRKK